LAYRGDPETGEPTEGFAHEHHIWHVDKVRFARAGSLPHPARNQPGTTSGPQWTRYQRTTLANSGQSSSQAIAAVRPVPQVMPQPRFSLARRKQGFKSPHLHPRTRRVRASPASSRRRSPPAGAALRPGTPMGGCSTLGLGAAAEAGRPSEQPFANYLPRK
jgi:hypothetical protein